MALLEDSAERGYFEELEARLAAGEQVEAEVSLTLVAGREVELDEDELRGASRRAVELLAAGGDPRRELEPEGRAAAALAADLDTPARRADLARGLGALRTTLTGLPQLTTCLEALLADENLSWRWLACTLLAEELSDG